MAGRPYPAVPTIFASEGTGVGVNNIPLLDADFADCKSDINDSAAGYVNYAADTGVANAYVLTLASAPSAYVAGMTVVTSPANGNTGASTINVNSLGAKSIVNPANLALNGGEITANRMLVLVYDGTSFRIAGPCPFIVNNQTLSANTTYNCAGFTSISALLSWNGGTGNTAIFQNVAFGIPVSISLGNGTGANHFYSVNMTNPSGVAYTNVFALLSGVSTGAIYSDIQAVSFQINTGNSVLLNGTTATNNQAFLSR